MKYEDYEQAQDRLGEIQNELITADDFETEELLKEQEKLEEVVSEWNRGAEDWLRKESLKW